MAVNKRSIEARISKLEQSLKEKQAEERALNEKLMDGIDGAHEHLVSAHENLKAQVNAYENALEVARVKMAEEEKREQSPEAKADHKRMNEILGDQSKKRKKIIEASDDLIKLIDELYASCAEYDRLAFKHGVKNPGVMFSSIRYQSVNSYILRLKDLMMGWKRDRVWIKDKLNS
jgi:DNA repair exonuclease SbcCD ATPase subunit